MSAAADLDRIAGIAAGRTGLRALLLFGSRARGDAAPTADWDLAYLADAPFDPADRAPLMPALDRSHDPVSAGGSS